ncbi:membrane protein of unknown function [Nitrospira sp. KM1]|uniref:PAS domain-containing sensor histidine kinase n=1 Tax=Nitrospira sp. KM1 TaxID=1936990 RepID=UPI0013A72EF8|nr:PAS domain-containing sensor histidine kinase [Nitrospira sp. KM1]BCA56159.1 membrane protein of unknown function [Nitrospira sp. KM1]
MLLSDKEWLRGGLMVLLFGALFALDTHTPLGFANHFLYTGVILIATGSRFLWMPSATAAIGTVLTITATFYGHLIPGTPIWIPLGNRAFTIIVLWILAWFAYKRRQAELALQKVNEGLEEKIAERTHQLAKVNEALVSEVTERMHTEQAYRVSQGRLAGILDIAEDAIIVMAEDRSISLFNQGAARLFGYEAHEILGHRIDILLPAYARLDSVDRSQGLPAARRAAEPFKVSGRHKDGSEFPAEASISRLCIDAQTTCTIILRDITERLRTEQQLKSFTSQLISAQEEERRRISRDLHDDINQRLALLAIEIGNLDNQIPLPAAEVQKAFQSLAQRIAVISDDVRRIAYQFHPSILDDLGLSAALRQLTDQFSSRTGIKTIVVQEDLPSSFPLHIASCLYRIAQESLANIAKHARASRVEVELTCDSREVTLFIRDSGVGFDMEQVEAGLGLVNMRERVRSVHGRLDIHSIPKRGTHVSVLIPLPNTRHEETENSLSR